MLWLIRSVVSDVPADLIIHVNNTKYQLHKVLMVFVFFIYEKLSPFPLMKHSYFPHGMLIKQFIFFELFTQTCICLVFSDSKVV